MTRTDDSRIVLRIPQLGVRWIVDYKRLAIYAQGKRNFTMRVPYTYDDINETNAYAFDGFLLVFKQQAQMHIAGTDHGETLTSYELGGCLQSKHIPFLCTYMRTLSDTTERRITGASHLRLAGNH